MIIHRVIIKKEIIDSRDLVILYFDYTKKL